VSPKEPANCAKTSGPLPEANPDVNVSPKLAEMDTFDIETAEVLNANDPVKVELGKKTIVTGLAFAF
jgi:hypothetical protein